MPLEPESLSFLGCQKLNFTAAPGLLLSLGESYSFSVGLLATVDGRLCLTPIGR